MLSVVRSYERHGSRFVFQLLAEQKKFDDEMRRQLKLQSEIHTDHLREALSVKEQETQRTVERALSEQADADSIKHKTQLAAVVGRLRALTAALKGKCIHCLFFLRVLLPEEEEVIFFFARDKCNRAITQFTPYKNISTTSSRSA